MLLATSSIFEAADFELQNGSRLAPLVQAYETWGRLAPTRDNAILLCHGYTSSPHAAGDQEGWWHNLIGPGRAIDTDRYYVVAPNMIGSAYGSSGPPSRNPATGRPFGPDFPDVTVADMVEAQRLLLDHLGVHRLAAVVGYSYGGYLTFHWGAAHPDMMRALVVVASGIKGRGDSATLAELQGRFAGCPGWNDGHYYDADPDESVRSKLAAMRVETLRSYALDIALLDELGDPVKAEAQLIAIADSWSRQFDANSLITLRSTAIAFDATPLAGAIRAPLLYVLARTDALFPPDLAPPTLELLQRVGVDAGFFEIESPYGHYAPTADWAKWGPALETFLARHATLD